MGYQLELRHIRYFLAVADELHFRKAAESLYISQPGLSRQIKELEENLGYALFERHNRKVELTQAGLFLQSALQKQLKTLEKSLLHAKHIDKGMEGEVSLSYVGSAMQAVIPTLLLDFKDKHDKIIFNLKELDNQHQVDGLLSLDLDIGFVRLDKVPKGLTLHPILVEPFCLALPASHELNAENFKSLDQLKNDSFILFDSKYSPSYYEKVIQIFDGFGFIPNVTHNTIHADSIYKLIENNFGVSIIPKSLKFDHLKGIKFIELNTIPQRTTLSAVWSIENKNPALLNFIENLRLYKPFPM